MVVWSVLTCQKAAVLREFSHCQYLWGNQIFLESMYMMCLSSLLMPFFCSISDASLFFLPNTHLSLSFVRPQARFVPVVERMVVPAFFCSLFLRNHVDPRVTILLYYSEAKKSVSVDTASPLTVFQSPITGWYLFCGILLEDLGLLLGVERWLLPWLLFSSCLHFSTCY